MLIVKKFGGTSVANKERIFNVANRCIEEYRKGNDVVVVLSAMGKYTDELITMARDVNEKPPKREMDMLFTIGEQMSVALMAMPLKLIRLSGSLADESFPGYIGSDTGITVAVSNPADHSIRIYGNGIILANIAQYNWVAV